MTSSAETAVSEWVYFDQADSWKLWGFHYNHYTEHWPNYVRAIYDAVKALGEPEGEIQWARVRIKPVGYYSLMPIQYVPEFFNEVQSVKARKVDVEGEIWLNSRSYYVPLTKEIADECALV